MKLIGTLKAVAIRYLVLSLLLCTTTNMAFAKNDNNISKAYNNSITISGNNYYFPDIHSLTWNTTQPFSEQLGIAYDRSIHKNFLIGIGYSKWNDLFLPSDIQLKKHPASIYVSRKLEKGEIIYRNKYKFYDINLKIQESRGRKNRLYLGFGLSYMHGTNEYFDSVVYLTLYQDQSRTYTHQEKHGYWGIIPMAGYDYMLLKNRVSIGAAIKTRKYFGLVLSSIEIDYGIHINFYM